MGRANADDSILTAWRRSSRIPWNRHFTPVMLQNFRNAWRTPRFGILRHRIRAWIVIHVFQGR